MWMMRILILAAESPNIYVLPSVLVEAKPPKEEEL